jgi:hypothetical protein
MKKTTKKETVGFPYKGGAKPITKSMAPGTSTVKISGAKATFSGGRKHTSRGK